MALFLFPTLFVVFPALIVHTPWQLGASLPCIGGASVSVCVVEGWVVVVYTAGQHVCPDQNFLTIISGLLSAKKSHLVTLAETCSLRCFLTVFLLL